MSTIPYFRKFKLNGCEILTGNSLNYLKEVVGITFYDYANTDFVSVLSHSTPDHLNSIQNKFLSSLIRVIKNQLPDRSPYSKEEFEKLGFYPEFEPSHKKNRF